MPELPEVETMCRGIAPIVGARVVQVERIQGPRRPIAFSPRVDTFRRRAEGKTVLAVERRGKRVVIWLGEKNGRRRKEPSAADEAIVIEPRMTGLVLLADPPTDEHLRFRMQLRGSGARNLWFWDRRGLGTVSLMSTSEFLSRFEGERATLGPDALKIDAASLSERLGRSRRAIKVALLDQRAVAGIGNLYASEILHLARIAPSMRCDRLSKDRWRRLQAAIVAVLEAAVRHEGSTLSDGTYRNALN